MLFLKNLLLRNFQGCCLLFNYQGSSLFLLIRSSFDILSHHFLFVKNFFHFLFAVCSGFFLPHKSAYLDYHIRSPLSRTFLSFWCRYLMCAFLFRKQRRRRDLNPRAATNDLLPFQGSPFGQLGYFSKVSASYARYSFSSSSLSLYL